MSQPLATVPGDALAYIAIGRMNRLGIRHLGVTDEAGRVVGALSARDLLRLRAKARSNSEMNWPPRRTCTISGSPGPG